VVSRVAHLLQAPVLVGLCYPLAGAVAPLVGWRGGLDGAGVPAVNTVVYECVFLLQPAKESEMVRWRKELRGTLRRVPKLAPT
jgi:hypothetical protein